MLLSCVRCVSRFLPLCCGFSSRVWVAGLGSGLGWLLFFCIMACGLAAFWVVDWALRVGHWVGWAAGWLGCFIGSIFLSIISFILLRPYLLRILIVLLRIGWERLDWMGCKGIGWDFVGSLGWVGWLWGIADTQNVFCFFFLSFAWLWIGDWG